MKTSLFVLSCSLSLALSLSAQSPFTPVPGQGEFRFHTDFTTDTAWNVEAGNFVTHPQATFFRPSGGGEIETFEDGLLRLEETEVEEETLFGTARLDLLDAAVLGEALSTDSEESFALYARVRFVTNSAFVIALGNDEAWQESPDPDDVRIVSGYVRSGSPLASWGQKKDFNNPADGEGIQVTDSAVPGYVDAGEIFDIALLFEEGTVSLYLKEETTTEWDLIGSPVSLLDEFEEGPGFLFDSNYLGLYTPSDGTEVEVLDFAISEAAEIPDDSFLAWWNEQGFDPSLEPDPLADNGDGLPYLLRHAWGLGATAPFDPTRQPMVEVSEEGEETYLAITFFLADEAESLDYEVGTSADLVSWDWASATPVGSPEVTADGTLYTYRDTVATNSADRRFLLVRYHWQE